MKEIFAGLMLAAALAVAVTSSSSDGRRAGARTPDRGDLWNDLRDRPEAPQIRDVRFVGPRNMPITVNSPAVLLEPAQRFADAIAEVAATLGGEAGPELGPSWLAARAARLALPDEDAAAPAPRAKGPVQRAPLPTPRPDPSQPAQQGVLSAALGLLEKAGLDALSGAGGAVPGDPALARKAGAEPAPAPKSGLPASHPDRAPGRPI